MPVKDIQASVYNLTDAVLERMLALLKGRPATGINQQPLRPTDYPHHFNVHTAIGIEEWPKLRLGEAIERYTNPVAAALADRVRSLGITRFAALDLPKHCEAHKAFDHDSGLSVRGVLVYVPDQSYELEDGAVEFIPEHMALRFDVLGGV